jgi:CrcB protein
MTTLLVVAFGGALGAVSRYLATEWIQALVGAAFPWGTFAVNVTGSLGLGFALVWLQAAASTTELRQLVAVGFLGSFTTFSTFSLEALAMLRDGHWASAGGYVAGSVLLGLAGVAAGIALAGAVTGSGGV